MKSCGNTGSVILYDNRIAKDRRLLNARPGRRLKYVVWRHTLEVGKTVAASNALADLHVGLLRATKGFAVVDFDNIEAWCELRPVKVMNTGYFAGSSARRCGYNEDGYGRGWSMPFREACDISIYHEEFKPWLTRLLNRWPAPASP